ncbi:MAG: TraB/GumN family protein [Gammaproteobacteria bacterium]
MNTSVLARRVVTPLLVLAWVLGCGAAQAAATHPLPLWRVTDAHGHTLYLAGSMHALKADDYPLPTPFTTAFGHSRRLVEEINLAALKPEKVQETIKQLGDLPAGKTLAAVMGTSWTRAQALAQKSDIKLGPYQGLKPWLAAVQITGLDFIRKGYVPTLGMDQHFAELAKQRGMPVTGLETFSEQMGFFNAMPHALQRRFLLQTLEKMPQGDRELARLHTAWRHGDTAELAAIANKDFASYSRLRKRLLDQRNRRWLPTLERCLAANDGCFVVVGAEHMVGPTGLVALLEKDGERVVQLHTVGKATPIPTSAVPAGA